MASRTMLTFVEYDAAGQVTAAEVEPRPSEFGLVNAGRHDLDTAYGGAAMRYAATEQWKAARDAVVQATARQRAGGVEVARRLNIETSPIPAAGDESAWTAAMVAGDASFATPTAGAEETRQGQLSRGFAATSNEKPGSVPHSEGRRIEQEELPSDATCDASDSPAPPRRPEELESLDSWAWEGDHTERLAESRVRDAADTNSSSEEDELERSSEWATSNASWVLADGSAPTARQLKSQYLEAWVSYCRVQKLEERRRVLVDAHRRRSLLTAAFSRLRVWRDAKQAVERRRVLDRIRRDREIARRRSMLSRYFLAWRVAVVRDQLDQSTMALAGSLAIRHSWRAWKDAVTLGGVLRAAALQLRLRHVFRRWAQRTPFGRRKAAARAQRSFQGFLLRRAFRAWVAVAGDAALAEINAARYSPRGQWTSGSGSTRMSGRGDGAAQALDVAARLESTIGMIRIAVALREPQHIARHADKWDEANT